MMSKVDIEFKTAIYTPEGREIFAVEAGQLVQARIMEDAIVSHIMPLATVDSEHLPKDRQYRELPSDFGKDGQVVPVWRKIRHGRGDISQSLISQARTEPMFTESGNEYPVPIGVRSTDLFERTAVDLESIGYDLLSLVKSTVLDQAVDQKDTEFIAQCHRAVSYTEQVRELDRPPLERDFTDIEHPGINQKIRPHLALVSERGLQVAGQAMGDARLVWVRSTKAYLLDWEEDGDLYTDIWLFSPADLLGDNLVLGRYAVWNQWVAHLFQFRGWDMSGIGIADMEAITKVRVKCGKAGEVEDAQETG